MEFKYKDGKVFKITEMKVNRACIDGKEVGRQYIRLGAKSIYVDTIILKEYGIKLKDGQRVVYKDGDYSNLSIDNFEIVNMEVRQLNAITGEVIDTFINASQASKFTGISYPNITSCLKGRTMTAGGFKWERG